MGAGDFMSTVKQLGRKAEHSLISSAEVKNAQYVIVLD
jgi:hypothetical protein